MKVASSFSVQCTGLSHLIRAQPTAGQMIRAARVTAPRRVAELKPTEVILAVLADCHGYSYEHLMMASALPARRFRAALSRLIKANRVFKDGSVNSTCYYLNRC